jgi:hypothetical protein
MSYKEHKQTLNEIRQSTQDMKEEFNKDLKILKKIKLKLWK